jgi:hypothetical protein
MPEITVVENPRRRRRRRAYSAAQRRAGFAGKRAMGRSRKRRRRNPAMASLAANPRRSRRRYYYAPRRRRRYRRNPVGFLRGFDFTSALWVTVGAIGSTTLPGLVKRWWPTLPTFGPMGYLVRGAATFLTSTAVRMATRNRRAADLVMTGGLAYILLDLYRDYVAPRIGLAGLGQDTSMITTEELEDVVGMEGYVEEGGYVQRPGVGQYVPSQADEWDATLAA